ncbi:hypothetical protein AYO38_00405 [bacterium SCGC AG-212-C10]|nr:hypothetical protein AYO38_00405 [bacterium SCGC AG-212-C10]
MQKTRVGDVEIVALIDNVMSWPASDVYASATPQMLEPFRGDLDEAGLLALNFGCFLLIDREATVLVDTGWGPEFNGKLLEELEAAGIQRDAIDSVIFTHLHGDHTGWNLDRATGDPLFPRARFLVPKADFDHYAAADPASESFQRDIVPLMALNRIDLLDGEHSITASLTAIPTPGHTPGHTSIAIASAGETGYILGDVVLSTIDAVEPGWANTFDTDSTVAEATRRRVIAELVANRALVGASHIAVPGLGRFVSRGGGTAWEPLRS